MDIKKMREQCGAWDDELGCMEDYPEACPISTECEQAMEDEEAESPNE